MKEQNVLNVLMYLFQNHMTESCELDRDANDIIRALEEAGFASPAIDKAIYWLEILIQEDFRLLRAPKATSTRVFTAEEKEFIDLECEGFIIALENEEILTPETRELVINQALALEAEFIDINLLKWITLMVLFNQPNCENALACMEFLVLDNMLGEAH